MKTLFAGVVVWATMMGAALAAYQPAKVIRMIDGDTIVIEAPWVPAPMKPQISIRVIGVDTPEKGHRAQCPQEAKLAEQASAHTKALLTRAKTVEVEFTDWDKYGGRVLGRVRIDGVDLTDSLISAGLARAYQGEKKQSWCN